ncbi:MAG: hypothetical protein ACRDK5_07905 [Solirubrobacterales bacterium]
MQLTTRLRLVVNEEANMDGGRRNLTRVELRGEPIGPAGRLARLGVGLAFIALAVFWRDPDWRDAVIGLLVAPAALLGLTAWRAQRNPAPLRATGPVGHALNLAVIIPAFLWAPTAGAAFLFYGASMLLAAVRGNGGCEVTALSNAVLGRDDQVGCALFAPVDLAEGALEGRRTGPSTATD